MTKKSGKTISPTSPCGIIILTAAIGLIIFGCYALLFSNPRIVAKGVDAPGWFTLQGSLDAMNSVQWRDYRSERIGETARSWEGKVTEVKHHGSDFEVYVNMDWMSDPLQTYDVHFVTSDKAVATYGRGVDIVFSGTISQITDVLGSCKVQLVDAVLE